MEPVDCERPLIRFHNGTITITLCAEMKNFGPMIDPLLLRPEIRVVLG